MNVPFFLVLLAPAFGGGMEARMKRAPEVILMRKEGLAESRTRLASGDDTLRPALAALLEKAEEALDAGPFSVTNKTTTPPSGDKHDYMSLGIYWWPDPKKKDGRPYIRRDGERNPESRNDAFDSPRLGRLVGAVETLALAYFFTGKEAYARRAAVLLRTWFLLPETRMNPHLKYAQGVPGRVTGRGVGIIDTVRLMRIPDAALLLGPSPSWTDADHGALRQWFKAYLDWLRTSTHGKDEGRADNNHGTWYDAQVACFALFVGDGKTAKEVLSAAGKKRIAGHITPDGRQSRELARTRSFDYSLFNLQAMFALARLAEHVDVDLWHFKAKGRIAIESALDYVAPYADARKAWPHKQITDLNRSRLLPLLQEAAVVYERRQYEALIDQLPDRDTRRSRARLLQPPGGSKAGE